MASVCDVCFRRCRLDEGRRGFCGARVCAGGHVVPLSRGCFSSVSLDPIEKKPLRHFMAGSRILSVGSFGCNMRCPFCQNSSISWSDEAMERFEECRQGEAWSPERLAELARATVPRGNIGVAFTYNEPLVNWEYVRDAARLLHAMGLKCVLVTNGCAGERILDELDGLVDAMNIDLKSFSASCYRRFLGGDLDMVRNFIARAAGICHVEITTLIVPKMNDSVEEMRQMAAWIADLADRGGRSLNGSVPYHVTRFFPCFRLADRPATDVETVRRLARVAGESLKHVYAGNC